MKPEQSEALDWLAFRFVNDELTESECQQFEQQLGDDQVAREAVARAVELTQTVAAASRLEYQQVASSKRADWWQRVALTAAATAACLAFALLYQFNRLANDDNPSSGVGQQHITADFASAWIATRLEFETADDDVFLEQNDELESLDADDIDADNVTDAEVEAPDWMFAALSAQNKSTGDQ